MTQLDMIRSTLPSAPRGQKQRGWPQSAQWDAGCMAVGVVLPWSFAASLCPVVSRACDPRGAQVLDFPLDEAHIRRRVAKVSGPRVGVAACNVQLAFRHIYACDEPLGADKRSRHVAVAAAPTARRLESVSITIFHRQGWSQVQQGWG